MQQLLSEPKVRAYSNPGTMYGPQAPLLTVPMGGGGGVYKQSVGMGPAPQMGMMVGGYPPQGNSYGMVRMKLTSVYDICFNFRCT